MNGSTTKFSTNIIKRQNQANQLLYPSSYEGKQNKLESNSGVSKEFLKFPLNEQSIKIFLSAKEKSYFLRWQYWEKIIAHLLKLLKNKTKKTRHHLTDQ